MNINVLSEKVWLFFEKQQFHFRHILLFQNNLEKEVRLFSDALNEFLLHFSAFT